MNYRLTTALRWVAWLYAATGAMFLLASLFAVVESGGPAPSLILQPLALLTLAAGVGLLRRAAWAWPLTLVLAASGVVAAAGRLWAGGVSEVIIPAIATNAIVLLVLFLARTRAGMTGA